MIDKLAISRKAMRAAFQVRRQLSIPREAPINPFNVSQALGVEVWFLDTPSLEGMFSRSPDPRIVLPSWNHRPFSDLVSRGLIRVIVSTNFDDLPERALEAVGVSEYRVVSDEHEAAAAPAYAADRCLVVKVHGDWREGRIRNSPEDVDRLPRSLRRLGDLHIPGPKAAVTVDGFNCDHKGDGVFEIVNDPGWPAILGAAAV